MESKIKKHTTVATTVTWKEIVYNDEGKSIGQFSARMDPKSPNGEYICATREGETEETANEAFEAFKASFQSEVVDEIEALSQTSE